MPENLIARSLVATPEEQDKHWKAVNLTQFRWWDLEDRRRDIARLITALTNDLEAFPSRHGEDSFRLYTGILRTLVLFEREIERQKDDVPLTLQWASLLVDALHQAIGQRRSLVMLFPALATLDTSKRTNDPDQTTFKVLGAAINQFLESAHKFLDVVQSK